MGHRRAVGLHEEVVDEVDAEVHILQAREFVPRRLGEPRAVDVDRVEARCRPASSARASAEKISFQP